MDWGAPEVGNECQGHGEATQPTGVVTTQMMVDAAMLAQADGELCQLLLGAMDEAGYLLFYNFFGVHADAGHKALLGQKP